MAYEKGYFLLRLLEETCGREKWDQFLRDYFDKFAFKTMTTEHFAIYLQDKLSIPESGISTIGSMVEGCQPIVLNLSRTDLPWSKNN